MFGSVDRELTHNNRETRGSIPGQKIENETHRKKKKKIQKEKERSSTEKRSRARRKGIWCASRHKIDVTDNQTRISRAKRSGTYELEGKNCGRI